MSICTYKDCEDVGIEQCGSDALLCKKHALEWSSLVTNPNAPVETLLGTIARATHKVRDKQVKRILGVT